MSEPIPTRVTPSSGEIACVYRMLRYTPNLVSDEWINIGVLLFNPHTGVRRLWLIEEEQEYRRVRRLHSQSDETLLRALRDDLEDRLQSAPTIMTSHLAEPHSTGRGPTSSGPTGNGSEPGYSIWQQLLAKWDDTLSHSLQLAPQKGVLTADLDSEMERLYTDHVAVPYLAGRVGAPGSRARVRSYCSQVFRQGRLWERIEKSVRVEAWTIPGDPMRRDYSYLRNGTRGFVHNAGRP